MISMLRKIVLSLVILSMAIVHVNATEFYKLKTPTLDILNEIESNATQIYVSGVNGLSDEQLFMILDKNYNFKMDEDEVREAIDMYFNDKITAKQLEKIIIYHVKGTKFTKTITPKEIREELKCEILFLDEEYYLGNPYASLNLIKKERDEINWGWYNSPWYDCDDFAWMGMGILHKHKEPAATATFYTLVMFKWKGYAYGHALLLVKALDGKWYYVDPTTMKVFEKDAVPFEILFMMG